MKFTSRTLSTNLSLLFILLLLLGAVGCKRSWPSRPSSEPAPLEFPSQIRKAIKTAGGTEVWITHSGHTRRASGSETSLQVLVASSAYRAVLAAVRQEAVKAHVLVAIEPSTPAAKLRASTLTLTQRSGTKLLQIHLREVPRILRAAIVIDDVGNDIEPATQLAKLEYPITFSVLPYLRATEASADEAHRNGHEVMLHLPMEPEAGAHVSPGKGAVLVGMSTAEVQMIVEDDLDAVPYVRGVNNHMGSRATQDMNLMTPVMQTLADRHLYFIDSRTTPSSVALKAARQEHVPTFYRSVFLDDTESVDYTLGQLRELLRIVEREGVALAIGHPHATTISALEQFLPEFERADIELVTPSQIVRLPEISSLHPTTPHGRE